MRSVIAGIRPACFHSVHFVQLLTQELYTGGTAMGENVLTDSEVLEIVYNSDENFRDSSSDSFSSSDIEIDDIAVADAK